MVAEVPVAFNVEQIVTLLQRCRERKDLLQAQYLQKYIHEHQLDSHTVIGNFLVPVLIDCGSLPEAQIVFDQLPHRNEYSWSSLIAGYVDAGDSLHALSLFRKMQDEFVSPNSYTYVALLRGCVSLTNACCGRSIHIEILTKGFEQVPFIGNTLIDMYGKSGLLAEAREVFDRLPVRDQVSWTALISVYAENGLANKSLGCFERMQLDGVAPNTSTFVCSMKACTRLKDAEIGWRMHSRIVLVGLETDLFIGNSLVDMYCKCGWLQDACQIFDMLPEKDQVPWTALISGHVEKGLQEEALMWFYQMQQAGIAPNARTFVCSLKSCDTAAAAEDGHRLCGEIVKVGLQKHLLVGSAIVGMYAKCGLLPEARDVFDELTARNTVSWTALIAGYAEYKQGEEALNCFQKMQLEGLSPDSFIYSCCIKACATIGALRPGQEFHIEVVKRAYEKDLSVANALVDMYGSCGLLIDGGQVFSKTEFRDVVSWTAMIKAYGENHAGDMAVQCFKNMQDYEVKPNTVTFTCILDACSHASLVTEGQEFFKMMKKKYNIEPNIDHYACIIDLLSRSGHLREAERFLDDIEYVESKEDVLTDLLSACKNHGELQLGIRCFQQLMRADKVDAAAFLMMAELYASASMWTDFKRIMEMRRDAGALKKPAYASIVVKGKLHEFFVGENQQKDVPVLQKDLKCCMRKRGHVPNIDVIVLQYGEEMILYEQETSSSACYINTYVSTTNTIYTHEKNDEATEASFCQHERSDEEIELQSCQFVNCAGMT